MEDEDYPLYEQIALIYYYEHKYPASIHFFLLCVLTQNENSMAWYGLGDSTCALGIEEKSDEIYDLGISFLRKSVSLDRTNQYSLSMLAVMFQAPHIGKERIEKIATFDVSDLTEIKEKYMLNQEVLNLAFKKCSNENRIRLAILLCDLGDFFSFELLNEVVINDTEEHVRLAIMKRLGTYSARTQLKQTFEFLATEDKWKSYEPYFSKTLSEIGSILTQLNAPDRPNWTKKVFNTIHGVVNVEDEEIVNYTNTENENAIPEVNKQKKEEVFFNPADIENEIEAIYAEISSKPIIENEVQIQKENPWWKFW
ncbi:hypothetical protein VB264_07200 [Arcicella aquatica]|uniref:HEAT repeat protein n=1 Tax=Arcicella aquatica TaxID=217141 RepID=A0ABU5QKH6_9BACT|nr:hypothetical protein [Arcicella aquatica]MEA5257563.1 hypothetical protein [Arcicella aquatica]